MSFATTPPQEDARPALTVSQLNRKVKGLLEIHLPLLWVEGEISNMSRPASGHWYFTLKDAKAQVSCVMFKGRNQRVKDTPQVGDHVKLRASVSLYEGRGDYQLIVEHLEPAGFGLLQKRFEELKEKLKEEGLFDESAKQALPSQVSHLAVITSPTGAAIRDVLSVLKRRFPGLPVTIIPSAVQGEDAPEQLIRALKIAEESPEFDVILLCRGGGSLEDLWSFNSETLARCIYDCEKPVVSAVGHEIDFTIADFVADLRAPTPSAAAELLSPNSQEVLMQFSRVETQLQSGMRNLLSRRLDTLIHLNKRLKHPRDLIQQWYQRFDFLESKLTGLAKHTLNTHSQQLTLLRQDLWHASPAQKVALLKPQLQGLQKNLVRASQYALNEKQQAFKKVAEQLHLVSPLATIERGYSVTRNEAKYVVQSIKQVKKDENISVQVQDGEIIAEIKDTVADKRTITQN